MRFTKIPADAFEKLQLNAGILAKSFTPATGAVSGLLGATTGGLKFSDTVNYQDFGEDIDNCPKNTLELKRIEDHEVKLGGTYVTIDAAAAQNLAAAADIDPLNAGHIIPRNVLKESDFGDLWWIGDYSDKNGNTNGGFVALHLMNALNTAGFQITSGDKAKGQFPFEYTGHYSIAEQDVVPYEVFIKSGEAETGDYYMSVLSAAGTTTGKTVITTSITKGSGESYVYQTGYEIRQPAAGTVLDGSAWAAWDGSAEITAASGMSIIVAIIDTTIKQAKHSGKTTVVAAEA